MAFGPRRFALQVLNWAVCFVRVLSETENVRVPLVARVPSVAKLIRVIF